MKRATLDLITKGLQAQYSQQGRYGASVEVSQRDRPRNRVEVSIEVDEGSSTAIASIEIIGNDVYSDDELKRIFEPLKVQYYLFLPMMINTLERSL